MPKKYDFCGWATKNNIKCSDGRTIMQNAFKECDGTVVPLVWQHQHGNIENVLGHALLENREEGVYAYGNFNDTYMGQNAKKLVEHGDIKSLSIFANKLQQNGGNVIHGVIRELSLVLAGANPEAYIEQLCLEHSEDGFCDAALILTEEPLILAHEDEEVSEEQEEGNEAVEVTEKSLNDILDTMNEEQRDALEFIVEQALSKEEDVEEISEEEIDELSHSEEKSVGDVLNTFNAEQKKVLYYLIYQALAENKDNSVAHSDIEEEELMKTNVFEGVEEEMTLSHDAMVEIINDAKKFGSLKESVLAHSGEYGIDNIGYLFPEYKSLNTPPEFIKRDTGWVDVVMGAVHHTPFSRIKSMFANITEDEARAKGYTKGNLKMEEVFGLLKRVTDPQTIYKKQKLDRDDIIDITDFNVVSWLKTEMRMMLDEEIARAVLIGDGRSSLSPDKISADHVRPIWGDASLFVTNNVMEYAAAATDEQKAKQFIKAAIKARKNYKGTGVPTLFTTEDMLTDMLLIEDTTGRVIYESVEKLATKLRVAKIVTVPVMENLSRTASGVTYNLCGIIVNLNDYNIGADKGGAVNMFDDFDIDYNQEKYLIETRCSGALIKPYSALTFEFTQSVG